MTRSHSLRARESLEESKFDNLYRLTTFSATDTPPSARYRRPSPAYRVRPELAKGLAPGRIQWRPDNNSHRGPNKWLAIDDFGPLVAPSPPGWSPPSAGHLLVGGRC